MRTKFLGAVVMFALAVALAVAGGEGGAKPFQGTWKLVGMQFQGKQAPKEFVEKLNIQSTYSGNTYTVKKGGEQEEKGKFKVDTAKRPNAIDFMVEEGKDKGKTQLGIYKIEGDTLTMVVGEPGTTDRPTSFESKAGEKHFTIIMKKANGNK